MDLFNWLKSTDNKKIYIIQGENKERKLHFMYKPFVNTVLNLYENQNCIYLYNNWKEYNFTKEDIVIFIGCVDIPNFKKLKQKNIYFIWYWTEPIILKKSYIDNCDEIYLYSKHLYYKHIEIYKNKQFRFIPILREETNVMVNYLKKKNNIKLFFIGEMKYRLDKEKKKFEKLNYFVEKNNIYNNESYNLFIESQTGLFINIIKPYSLNVLPFSRICKILSHGGIIISKYTNKHDDDMFKDLIYFYNNDEELTTIYNTLKLTPPAKLNEISQKIYKVFCERFNKNNKNIFLYSSMKSNENKTMALLLFGVSYRKIIHHRGKIHFTNYEKSLENYKQFIFNYFKKLGYKIDIYISTNQYEDKNEFINFLNTYRPIKYTTLPDAKPTKNNSKVNILSRNEKINSVIDICLNENKNYDLTLITRFDLLFKKRFETLNFDLNKINISSILEKRDMICDNFYLFDYKYLRKFSEMVQQNIEKSFHIIEPEILKIAPIHFFNNENCFCEQLTFYKINHITYAEKKIEERFKNKLDQNFLISNHRKKFQNINNFLKIGRAHV